MDLEIAKQLLQKYTEGHASFIENADVAERYYKKKNDILFQEKPDKDLDDPLHQADNRIPSNFFKLLVNQKASYAFTVPPRFDVGNDESNKKISHVLGDAWAKKCKSLCVQASKTGIGWLHYWMNESGEFKYSVIDSRQIVPIWTKALEKELKGVLRFYDDIDETDGYTYTIYEIWTDTECQTFRKRIDLNWDGLDYYQAFQMIDIDSGNAELTDTYRHDFGEVPFIFFNNNDETTSDLDDIKEIIDSHDKAFSGFTNDLEDIQEIIFILTNYSGEANNTAEVLREMKKKVITVESDGPDDKSGISTLSIEIPVEARKEFLQMSRKSIFEQGMGIDPDPQNFGNSSGVALQYLYSLIELKTGMMETEFRISFNRLVRAICRHYNLKADNITQIWKRTSVTNDSEKAEICNNSKGVISDETIVRNHPLVDDPETELERMKKEKEEAGPDWDEVPPVDTEDGD